MADFFVVDAAGPVVRIHLNRPEQGNAFTPEMMHTFAGLLRGHGKSAETRLIALTAEGKLFSMGRDPNTPKPEKEPTAYELRKTVMAGVLGAYEAIRDTPVPVVACVQGDALGFGAALAGCCDITLVSSAAHFAFPEIEHNIPATLGVSAVLSMVPLKAAKWAGLLRRNHYCGRGVSGWTGKQDFARRRIPWRLRGSVECVGGQAAHHA